MLIGHYTSEKREWIIGIDGGVKMRRKVDEDILKRVLAQQ
jgi:hypothetical protein